MMMNDSQRSLLRTHGTMVGRMLIGLLFVSSGVSMVMGGVGNTADYFNSLELPMAGILAYVVIAIKIGAGGALMLGYRTGVAAAALTVFTLGTIVVAHLNPDDMNLWKNLAIVGGLLYTMAYGAGEGWSLDKGSKTPAAQNDMPDELSGTPPQQM